jgi:hypothetical protein
MSPLWQDGIVASNLFNMSFSFKVLPLLPLSVCDELLKLGISLNPEDTPVNLFLILSILPLQLCWNFADL